MYIYIYMFIYIYIDIYIYIFKSIPVERTTLAGLNKSARNIFSQRRNTLIMFTEESFTK